MTDIAIDTVSLVALLVEGILYGILLFMFGSLTFVLLRRRRNTRLHDPPHHSHLKSRIHIISFFVASIMLLLGTIHVGVDLYRVLDAFIFQVSVQTPIKTLSAIDTETFLVKICVYYLQTLVGDGFWIYRTCVIWNNDKKIATMLSTFLLASAAIGIRVLVLYSGTPNIGDPIFESQINAWAISYVVSTLIINLGCTGLIAGRIWYSHHKLVQSFSENIMQRPYRLPTTTYIVIESGVIYSVCLIILLGLHLRGSYAQYIVNDAVTQIIGIVFTLIILQVVLGISDSRATSGAVHSPCTFARPHALVFQRESVTSQEVDVPAEELCRRPVHTLKPSEPNGRASSRDLGASD